jgi:hypothetical protein
LAGEQAGLELRGYEAIVDGSYLPFLVSPPNVFHELEALGIAFLPFAPHKGAKVVLAEAGLLHLGEIPL